MTNADQQKIHEALGRDVLRRSSLDTRRLSRDHNAGAASAAHASTVSSSSIGHVVSSSSRGSGAVNSRSVSVGANSSSISSGRVQVGLRKRGRGRPPGARNKTSSTTASSSSGRTRSRGSVSTSVGVNGARNKPTNVDETSDDDDSGCWPSASSESDDGDFGVRDLTGDFKGMSSDDDSVADAIGNGRPINDRVRSLRTRRNRVETTSMRASSESGSDSKSEPTSYMKRTRRRRG